MLISMRRHVRTGLLLAGVLLAAAPLAQPAHAASGIDGLWDAIVVANGSVISCCCADAPEAIASPSAVIRIIDDGRVWFMAVSVPPQRASVH